MNNKRSIAFTVELLGLFILLILVIVMITQIFVMSRAKTVQARRLTQAVMIAQSMAEAASSEKDLSLLADRMQDMGNIESAECNEAEQLLDIVYDTDGKAADKDFRVVLHRSEDERDGGTYVSDMIEVYYCTPDRLGNKIYDLNTGRHFTAEEEAS